MKVVLLNELEVDINIGDILGFKSGKDSFYYVLVCKTNDNGIVLVDIELGTVHTSESYNTFEKLKKYIVKEQGIVLSKDRYNVQLVKM